MDMCPAVSPGAAFISSMTAFIDCQAQVLGSAGWAALAGPSSTLTAVLTGFLTIMIALIGYNLLLGHQLTVRSGTLTFVKIGAVFAFATSWPAYRTVVYDVVTAGPSQLVGEIGPRTAIAGSDGTLLQRLDLANQAMAELAIVGPSSPPSDVAAQTAPPPFGGFDTFALGGSRILFELSSIAGLGIVRVIDGLMLAIGPFFIAFLMFENTRSLFEGWVRVVGGAALAALGVAITLGLELALLETWLRDVLARRMAGEALPMVPTELFVITSLFSILVVAAICASARAASAFRLAPLLKILPVRLERNTTHTAAAAMQNPGAEKSTNIQRSRAAAVAGAVASINRRELREIALGKPSTSSASSPTTAFASANDPTAAVVRLGRSFTRRPNSRASARAARRDAGA